MGTIKAEGILRHCFHGSYSAVIALEFANEDDIDASSEQFNISKPFKDIGDWKKSVKHSNILLGSLNEEQIEAFKDVFKPKCVPCNSFGCKNEIHEIDGIEHSIDVGSEFEVVLEVVDKNQQKLF